MKNLSSSYPYFMSHPFWELLRIQPQSPTFSAMQRWSSSERKAFVTEAVKGFYPVSFASLLAFRRFSELAEHPEAKSIAYEIYEVENGQRPLIEGSDMTGIRHCDQLRIMFESLLGEPMELEAPEAFEVLVQSDINGSDLVKAMAICDLIENTAPYVIHFYQDFLIQCQLAMGVSSEGIKRTYLDEHNLTEGDACEEQHIEMLNKMKGNYRELESSQAYAKEKEYFIRLVSDHFQEHYQRMAGMLENH